MLSQLTFINTALSLFFLLYQQKETAWDIKDTNYSIVASSSSAYTTANTTVIENLPSLANGDYLLVIYDSGGNGISYPSSSVSYTLKDGQGAIISGDRFQHSAVNEFCVKTGNGGGLDLASPSVPTIIAFNPTQTTIDVVVSIPSTDNHLVIGYILLIDGQYVGDIPTGGSLGGTVPGLTPNTPYSFQIAARDVAGNFSPLNNPAVESTLPLSNSTTFHQGYFETGWDNWIDGGVDCKRYTGNKPAEGTHAIRLRDNSGVASSLTLQNQDITSFTDITIDFKYYIHSFEANEDFWFRYWNGTSWQTVATFQKGVDFTGNGFNTASHYNE